MLLETTTAIGEKQPVTIRVPISISACGKSFEAGRPGTKRWVIWIRHCLMVHISETPRDQSTYATEEIGLVAFKYPRNLWHGVRIVAARRK